MEEFDDTLSVAETIDSVINSHTTSGHNIFEMNVTDEIFDLATSNDVEEGHSSPVVHGCSVRDKFCKSLFSLCLITVVVGVMLIPIILYYTNPSSTNFNVTSISGIIDLESCLVRYDIELLIVIL